MDLSFSNSSMNFHHLEYESQVILETKVKSIHLDIERDLVWYIPFAESNIINVGVIFEDTSKFGRTNSQDKSYMTVVNSRICNPFFFFKLKYRDWNIDYPITIQGQLMYQLHECWDYQHLPPIYRLLECG